jgi:hypothetical protein
MLLTPRDGVVTGRVDMDDDVVRRGGVVVVVCETMAESGTENGSPYKVVAVAVVVVVVPLPLSPFLLVTGMSFIRPLFVCG